MSTPNNARAVVAFPSAQVLGGVDLTVPAGSVVRSPASPDTLDFTGYNTLSLKLNVQGLGGGDVLRVYVAAADPESPTLEPLPDGLSQVLAITADADGDWADTVNLVEVLAGSGSVPAQQLLPIPDTWQGGWGCNAPDFSVACQSDDGITSIIQGTDTSGGVACKLAMDVPVDPGVYTGWTLNVIAAANNPFGAVGAVIGVDILVISQTGYSTPGTGGGTFSGPEVQLFVGYIGATVQPQPTLGPMTDVFQTFTFPLSPAEAAAIAAVSQSSDYLVFFPITRTNVGDPGSTNTRPNITKVYINVPAGGAGGGQTIVAIPFYKNMLLFDATDSTSDVTVSVVMAELSNQRIPRR